MGTEQQTVEKDYSRRIEEALEHIIHLPQYSSLLSRFMEAYTYRSQFQFLGESGNWPGKVNKNGVAYALRQAIGAYISNAPISSFESAQADLDSGSVQNRLLEAVKLVFGEEEYYAQIFFHSLVRMGTDVSSLEFDQLVGNVVHALEQYIGQSSQRVHSDPW